MEPGKRIRKGKAVAKITEDKRTDEAADEREAPRPKKMHTDDSAPAAYDGEVVSEVVKYESSPLPRRYYDLDTTEPISFSLKSLEDLQSWSPTDADKFNVASVPLASRRPPLCNSQKRTLVCHDFMGGYVEDRFIQGAEAETVYTFYHWQYIDIFVYFSHHMVTVPPVCWTNAAHRHGVSILGTFITEWTDGANICESFLESESSLHSVANKLVEIALYYGFDGWLINIENQLSETAVKNLPTFLQYLTDKMHQALPGSLILWYDSVLETGKLQWQNELNSQNMVFFNSCDGIFTNYNWTEEHLKRMISQAAHRLSDIYVGVDVFARGDVVGGKFDTHKSLKLIRQYNLSAAIFAPGWVYECNDKKQFRQTQSKFWSMLYDYLPTHSVAVLPFVTSFCQGFGKCFYLNGKAQSVKSWFNLSAQEVQPLFFDQVLDTPNNCLLRTCCSQDDAWNGGSSLLIEGVIPVSKDSVSIRLFSLQVPAPPRIFISFVYKLDPSSKVKVAVQLEASDAPLCNFKDISLVVPAKKSVSSLMPECLSEDDPIVKEFTQNCGMWSNEGWILKCYLVELKGCWLQDIFINISKVGSRNNEVRFVSRIGEIKVLDAAHLSEVHPSVTNLSLLDVVWRQGFSDGDTFQLYFNGTFCWQYSSVAAYFKIYWRLIHGSKSQSHSGEEVEKCATLIGRAYATVYRVIELPVPKAQNDGSCWMEFLVEPVSKEGFIVDKSKWGKLRLKYSMPPCNLDSQADC
ncbi:cytosolic endo-beta-N-acetylglucosaminidase [Polypterus senegalus]|uniref:cytosolic endo-beta-N-acetylglucosaminidase n=1 Tax=Polypterus senegalus TaxID=55291 RepID=UPI0019659B6D|nr:cytosolic endo-beta-N-acetylglucosaminidase [Polypterus senegalus]